MRALIVLVHPEPRSFNAALAAVAATTLRGLGHEVAVSDPYAEGFEPAEGPAHYAERADPLSFSAVAEQRHASRAGTLPPAVRREIARLESADLVVFQFPLWWHAPPAMLKGWLDRVFVSGGLYTATKRYERGHFAGRRAVAAVTTGAPAEAFGPGARGGDPDTMLWPLHYSLHYMGFSVLPPFLLHAVQGHGYAYGSDDEAAAWREAGKAAWAGRLRSLDGDRPLRFPGWTDWDAHGRALPRSGDAATGGSGRAGRPAPAAAPGRCPQA